MKKETCLHPLGWQEKRRFRHYHPINKVWGGRCPECKSHFAVELLENPEICPQCKVELKPTWEIHSEIYCPICKENQIYRGILS